MANDNLAITTTRLHISPLTPDNLPFVLGAQLLKSASNISFHSIQTAPDTPYGYVDLPSAEADKVKKKLHGAILKGKKMKVEVARPKKRRHVDVDDDNDHNPTSPQSHAPEDGQPARPRDKKAADDRNTIPGHELPPDRKVKRGWTEQKTSSSKNKDRKAATTPARPASKFTDKEELLFRTKVPENKADMATKSKKKTKKTDRKTTTHSQVIHEFERNTVQPTFLKDESTKRAGGELHYVDGQGWVDGQGKLVEKEPTSLLQRREAKREAKRAKALLQEHQPAKPESDATSPSEAEAQPPTEPPTIKIGASSPPRPQEALPVENEPRLHPLEAIFKKPQKPASSQDVAKPSLEVQTTFSFFGDLADEDLDDEAHEPMTPFTSQDMRFRGLRSAAPTPDTARPSRFNSYSSVAPSSVGEGSQSEQDDDEDIDTGEALAAEASAGAGAGVGADTPATQESPFVKAFWEKRGENNRAWKARRRTVLKEKRQRENRARRPKNW